MTERKSDMKIITKIAKTLCISLVLSGAMLTFINISSVNAGEAALSGSDEYRNIIGFEMADTTPAQGAITGCNGVYVNAVIPGLSASIAGLKVGDVITKINNFAVANKPDAFEVMDALDAGKRYPFEVCRLVNGQVQTLTLNILVEKVQEKQIAKIS
jgi:S1-C subfamily serine protease